MRALTYFLLFLFSASTFAGILPPQQREAIIQAAFANFWGKAKLRNGASVQPDSEAERATLPISKSTANHVISVGELSGIAEWCGLNWQSHFLSLTAAARQQGFAEKQVAFIGLLHGVTQGNIYSTMREKPCPAEFRANASKMLEQSPVKKAIPK